eukprot:4272125-Pleurochrysis_carterae.AAC.1
MHPLGRDRSSPRSRARRPCRRALSPRGCGAERPCPPTPSFPRYGLAAAARGCVRPRRARPCRGR